MSIVGLGKLGAALASQLCGCTSIKGWDVVDTGLDIQTDTLYECIKDTDTIFIVVPSEHFEKSLNNIIKAYSDNSDWHKATKVNMISFTKGICNNKLPIDIIKNKLPHNPCGVISGPMLSEELYNRPTRAVLASDNMGPHSMSGIKMRMGKIKLDSLDDVTGVTLCGIVKNVYALGMGMLAGTDAGENMKSVLATLALNEMESLVGNTVKSYAGIGDFLTTCYSPKSRNYTYGYNLAAGEDVSGIMSEGVKNLDHLLNYTSVDLPVVNVIKSCLEKQDSAPLLLFLDSWNTRGALL